MERIIGVLKGKKNNTASDTKRDRYISDIRKKLKNLYENLILNKEKIRKFKCFFLEIRDKYKEAVGDDKEVDMSSEIIYKR